jgi:hypothetical protein
MLPLAGNVFYKFELHNHHLLKNIVYQNVNLTSKQLKQNRQLNARE